MFKVTLEDELKIGYKLIGIDDNKEIIDIETENYPKGIEVYNLSFDDDMVKLFCITSSMIVTACVSALVVKRNFVKENIIDSKVMMLATSASVSC